MEKVFTKRLFNQVLPTLMLIVCSILGTTDAWVRQYNLLV